MRRRNRPLALAGSHPAPCRPALARRRRRGRSAHLRSPDDTPLRDGNRDRLMGLLTERAARTLELSVSEGNPSLQRWLGLYLGEKDIPKAC